MFDHFASIIGMNTTTYSVAIKKPNTREYLYWNSYDYPQKKQFLHGVNINTWIKYRFERTKQQWTNWAIYNDQLPNGKRECCFLKGINNSGHCKGIVVWNSKKVGWLIHSVPKFPSTTTFDINNLCDIDDAELKFAQSMIYIELPAKYKTQIINQLAMMDAQLYDFNGDLTITENNILNMFNNALIQRKSTEVVRLPFWGVSAFHCAKNRNYCRDFYENIACLKDVTTIATDHSGHFGASFRIYRNDRNNQRRNAIADVVVVNNPYSNNPYNNNSIDKVSIECETWTNGEGQRLGSTDVVTNLTAFAGWKTTCDHSKWAISSIGNNSGAPASLWTCCMGNKHNITYRVCIGDLNHMSSQMIRGGGGIIIDGNKALWMCFYSLAHF